MAETHIAFMARERPAEPHRPPRLRLQPHSNKTTTNYHDYHGNDYFNNSLDNNCKYPDTGPRSDDSQSISPVSRNLSLIRYLSPVSTFSQRAILHLEQIAAQESLENHRSRGRGRSNSNSSDRRSRSTSTTRRRRVGRSRSRSASSASSSNSNSKRSRSTSSTGRRSISSASSSPSTAGSDILDYYKTAWSPSSPTSPSSPSSCYSRRSSITSIGSDEDDVGRDWYTSADAFSIGDPVAMGVFDEDDNENNNGTTIKTTTTKTVVMDPEIKCTSTSTASPISISSAKLNKPLPREPPIALAPLKVRKKRQTSTRRRISSAGNKGLALRPTLAQAEQELQNALDECTSQPSKCISSSASAGHDVTAVTALLNAPLQISRGSSRMTPSRPAPRPPPTLSYSQRQILLQQQQQEQLQVQHHILQRNRNGSRRGRTKTGGIQKMPFHLTVPGLGRKLHLRSFSSSQLRDMVPKDEEDDNDDDTKNKGEKRPASVGNERNLRSQPRFQTKTGLNGALAAVTAAATASTVSPFTFQVKGSNNHSFESIDSRVSRESKESRESGDSKDLGDSGVSKGSRESSESVITGGPVQPPNVDAYDDKIFVACSRMPSYGLPLDQLIKLYNKPNVFELDSTSAAPPIRVDDMDATPRKTNASSSVPRTIKKKTKTTPWQLPDKAVRSILENAGSLDDLFSMAVTSRQFYQIFKRHELSLIKTAVYQMSPAAWELREMSPPWDSEWQGLLDPDAPVPDYTPSLYLQRYAHDIFTLAQLKSLILARCCSFLRPDTIQGLAGANPDRATAMDDAFWRIWTFCRIFGSGKGRENDIAGQMDWMNGGVQARSPDPMLALSITEPFGMNNVLFEPPAGFAEGNPGGLSQSQMYDMTELFTCLGVLMQPIHGKCAEARRAGIYNGFDIKVGDNDKEEKHLEEWTAYVLTLGLSAVLSLGSICPIKNATATFQKAQSMGLTKWDLADGEITRSSFLKDAVSKTYKSREEAFSSNRSSRSSAASSSTTSPSSSRTSLATQSTPDLNTTLTSSSNSAAPNTTTLTRSITPDQPAQEHRLRQAAFAEELRIQRSKPRKNGNHNSFSEERPLSSYTVVMNGLEGLASNPSNPSSSSFSNVPPVPALPDIHPALRPEPVLRPESVQSQSAQIQTVRSQPTLRPSPSSPETPGPGHDPVDRAIDIMVRELGFSDSDAKWALRTTDTGEGVNVSAAVTLLLRRGRPATSSSLSSPVSSSSLSSMSTTVSTPGGLGLSSLPAQGLAPGQGLGPIQENFV